MENEKPTLLILAAGLGSRYGSLKQIDRIGPTGQRIIDYSVFDALRVGYGKIVYVIRKSFEDEFRELILDTLPPDIEADYVFQEFDSIETKLKINPNRTKPWGTGHALLCASSAIDGNFTVINADDFYGVEAFKLALNYLTSVEEPNQHALIGYKLVNTMSDFGSVSRGVCDVDHENYIKSIVERTEIKKDGTEIIFKDENSNWCRLSGIEIVSMNMFAFQKTIFEKFNESFNSFLSNYGNDLKTEFYIPTVVDELIKSTHGKVKVVETNEEWFGLTYKEDKKIVIERLANLIELGKYPIKLW